jgi:hypothetical protein
MGSSCENSLLQFAGKGCLPWDEVLFLVVILKPNFEQTILDKLNTTD